MEKQILYIIFVLQLLSYACCVMLLTEHHFEFPSLKGDCTGSSESTLVKMPHCWRSHVAAQITNPHGIQKELPFKGPGAFKIACRIILFPYTMYNQSF